jgi:type IX secretion system PorP/SprF family membrane protein
MKKIAILFVIVLTIQKVEAQQDAMYSHYAFNTLSVNPGYAGTSDALTFTALHRKQWVGFDGAPITQTFTMHTPFFNERIGAGFSFINDQIGPLKVTSFYGDFSAKVRLTEKIRMSFGLKGGGNMLRTDFSDMNLDQQNDAAFNQNIKVPFLLNFGVGTYVYTTRWYAGISTPRMLENDISKNPASGSVGAKEKRHFFIIGGAVFNLTPDRSFLIKPTTYIKVAQAVPIQIDFTAMVIYKETFEAGAMLRSGDAIGLLLGYNISNQMRVGYSYDISFTNTTFKHNGGSHEIMFRYDFVFNSRERIRSPRYF